MYLIFIFLSHNYLNCLIVRNFYNLDLVIKLIIIINEIVLINFFFLYFFVRYI